MIKISLVRVLTPPQTTGSIYSLLVGWILSTSDLNPTLILPRKTKGSLPVRIARHTRLSPSTYHGPTGTTPVPTVVPSRPTSVDRTRRGEVSDHLRSSSERNKRPQGRHPFGTDVQVTEVFGRGTLILVRGVESVEVTGEADTQTPPESRLSRDHEWGGRLDLPGSIGSGSEGRRV